MLTRMDDYLIHQTEKTLAEVASDHPEWQDRFYFNIHDWKGDFAAATGLGVFPNQRMKHAYLFVVNRDQHYFYLDVSPLDVTQREVMQSGSLSFQVLEPFQSWRLELADEANDIHASLEFHARYPAYLFKPIEWSRDGELVIKQMHLTQAGRYSGSFRIGDEVFTDLWGVRDRSWGIRVVPPLPFYHWIQAEFPNLHISIWQFESEDDQVIYLDGAVTRDGGRMTPITRVEHQWELRPGTKRPARNRLTITTADGEVLPVEYRECHGLFFGYRATRWSETDPQALAEADAKAVAVEQYCEFTLGQERGYGIVEVFLVPGKRRYGVPPTPYPAPERPHAGGS